MKQTAAVLVYLFAHLYPTACSAQSASVDPRIKRIDEIARYYTGQGSFMGTVLVAEGDKVLLSKGYGFANLEWKIRQQPDVEFHLASLSKQFTAAAILLLQEDGKLHLTDLLSTYLPNTPKVWASITIDNLLSHTSGLKDFTDDPRFAAWSMVPQTRAEQMTFLGREPLQFRPGSQFVYCNTNYLLLAMIVEAASGMRFRDVVQQRLFDKIGMKHTGSDTDELILPHRAAGYTKSKAGWERVREVAFTDTSVDGGAGLYSTTQDLLLWEEALFGGKVLTAASLAIMTRQGLGNYGAGLFHDMRHGETVFEHSGGMQGFSTDVSYMPDRKVTVIVLSNTDHSTKGVIAGQILDTMLSDPVVLDPNRMAEPQLSQLRQLVGTYSFPTTAPDQPVILSLSGDALYIKQGDGPAMRALYEGRAKGRLRFVAPGRDVEFQVDASGDHPKMIFHWDEDAELVRQPASP